VLPGLGSSVSALVDLVASLPVLCCCVVMWAVSLQKKPVCVLSFPVRCKTMLGVILWSVGACDVKFWML
jgi:hypothetical protein